MSAVAGRRHLVIFVKAPQRGAVKTRLARAIGGAAAQAFYRRLAAATIARLGGDRRWQSWLAVAPDGFARRGRFWPPALPRRAQGPGDLGRRMTRPLRQLPPGPVVMVGSDIPGLDRRHVAAAFRALGRCDAVFGPAADGGYWLVGLRRHPRRDPFRGVAWSGPQALADTLANLRGAQVAMLETLEDVDDGADYERWRARGGSF